jgi:hypothetical protein
VAIKGKGKTKSRPAPRAPRHGPVDVPVPLVRRRWVQMVASFVLGVLVVMFVIWFTNGLRAERRDREAQDAATSARAAVAQVQQTFEGAVGTAGQVTPGQPPTIQPQLAPLLDQLAKGDVPEGAEDTLKGVIKATSGAADAIETYEVATNVRDKGLDVAVVNYLLNAQQKLVAGLRGYSQAAKLAQLAVVTTDPATRKGIADRANELVRSSNALIAAGWNDLTQAEDRYGLAQQPQIPGLGTGAAS